MRHCWVTEGVRGACARLGLGYGAWGARPGCEDRLLRKALTADHAARHMNALKNVARGERTTIIVIALVAAVAPPLGVRGVFLARACARGPPGWEQLPRTAVRCRAPVKEPACTQHRFSGSTTSCPTRARWTAPIPRPSPEPTSSRAMSGMRRATRPTRTHTSGRAWGHGSGAAHRARVGQEVG